MSNSQNQLFKQSINSEKFYSVYKPIIINLENSKDRKLLNDLFKRGKVWNVVEETVEQQKELRYVKNPRLLNSRLKSNDNINPLVNKGGRWIYYPWSGQLVHILKPDSFKRIRLSRNNNLIDKLEQKKYEKITVAFAGLNVGNSAAVAIALEGGSTKMRFADNDSLSLSNLNRFRASLNDLGLNKAIISARQIYEINPFADVKVYDRGLTEENIRSFLLKPKVDILVEEMDNLVLKVQIRKYAKQYKIPVVMVTGNGEKIILDIERYDRDPNLKILNGKLSQDVQNDIKLRKYEQSVLDFGRLCQDFIGKRYLTTRLRKSFTMLGKDLVGIPQIAEVSFLRGAALALIVRRLALGDKNVSGRHIISIMP